MTAMTYEEQMKRAGNVGPCTDCGNAGPRKAHRGVGALCYDCWHAARERCQCWRVRLIPKNPDYPDFLVSGAYLEEEARKLAEERTRPGERWEAIPWPSWEGDRMRHPGYLQRRAEEIRKGIP